MNTQPIYLALYKGRRDGSGWRVWCVRATDWLIRTLTHSIYSHCELAVLRDNGQYDCYSSSIRDGGVRLKTMPLPPEKWDLIPVRATEAQVRAAFETTRGTKYDWLGATGVIARWRHDRYKWFCSEWCSWTLGLPNPERFCPGSLAEYCRTHGKQ